MGLILEQICKESENAVELDANELLKPAGAMYDVDTGKVDFSF